MAAAKARRKRSRGSVEELRSGALRVAVYAGLDPLTGRRHYLREVIPPGPTAAAEAEKAMRRLAGQVDERRHPRTNATLDQLLDRYLETLDVSPTTHAMYAKYLQKHVRPFVGKQRAGAVGVEVLDSLYAELRRCRVHCTGKGGLDHRTLRPHECDERCQSHRCNPLSSTTIRHIHFILRAAYEKGVRWQWVGINPVQFVDAPAKKAPDPQPPGAEEAARLVLAAWEEPEWGTLVWLTMVTGARRGELCALRWSHVDLDRGALTIRRALARFGAELTEKDTKTHQQRRLTLDPETVAVLTEHWERCRERAAALGEVLARDAFVFSLAPDSSTPLIPASVTQRYSRMAARLGIETHLHSLRHYSATELIAAGVDVRTVAGRLGHSGGGVTTLRVYAAWLAEADQRAATGLITRLPSRPAPGFDRQARTLADPRSPRERIAAELHAEIVSGVRPNGSNLPGIKAFATANGVSPSTVHRAYELLREWGVIAGEVGRRCTVVGSPPTPIPIEDALISIPSNGRRLLSFRVRCARENIAQFSAEADPDDAGDLRRLLTGAVRRRGLENVDVSDYELDVLDGETLLTTFVIV